MNTSSLQILKTRAHHLKPVIMLGHKGLTEAVIEETHAALSAHELIKIKLSGLEREDKVPVVTELSQKLQAECIQLIGNMATFYRKNPEKKAIRLKKTVKKSIKKPMQQSSSWQHDNDHEKKSVRTRKPAAKLKTRTMKGIWEPSKSK